MTMEQTPKVKEHFIEANFLKTFYECEERLIRRQDEIIEALEIQIADAEQELYEKDRRIVQLENDLDEICEMLLPGMNLQ